MLNYVQTCVRLAVDAGIHLIIPNSTRNRANDPREWNHQALLSTFINMEHFESSIKRQCPNMIIVNTAWDIRSVGMFPEIGAFTASRFGSYLDEEFGRTNITYSAEDPLRISTITLYRWRFEDGPAEELKALFEVRRTELLLVRPNPTLQTIGSTLARHASLQTGFIGIHLRIESDGWHTYEKDAVTYLDKAMHYTSISGIRVLYVSCGDRAGLEKFKADGVARNLTVVTKWDLVVDPTYSTERTSMENLMFDQLAIVDATTLTHSTYFVGTGGSSFSRWVARHREFFAGGQSDLVDEWYWFNKCCW
ncbi:hypothetical protein HK104_001647 [Borealophlyctis nickersoniae]|nr:hypothetical protein HK104_001647 [Borealophlyctis nickersoniae]